MKIKQARDILGKDGEKLSDESISRLLQKMKTLAIICMEKIDNKNKQKDSPLVIV